MKPSERCMFWSIVLDEGNARQRNRQMCTFHSTKSHAEHRIAFGLWLIPVSLGHLYPVKELRIKCSPARIKSCCASSVEIVPECQSISEQKDPQRRIWTFGISIDTATLQIQWKKRISIRKKRETRREIVRASRGSRCTGQAILHGGSHTWASI